MKTHKLSGVELIAHERARQIWQEDWTPKHDDMHKQSELAYAAACYALQAGDRRGKNQGIRSWWPWERKWWKPSEDPVRNLVKAGALIAAEIDRLQRAKKT